MYANSTQKEPVHFSGPLRSNESHISLLTTVLRGQLTSILRAKNQITVAATQVKDIDYNTSLRIARRMRFKYTLRTRNDILRQVTT